MSKYYEAGRIYKIDDTKIMKEVMLEFDITAGYIKKIRYAEDVPSGYCLVELRMPSSFVNKAGKTEIIIGISEHVLRTKSGTIEAINHLVISWGIQDVKPFAFDEVTLSKATWNATAKTIQESTFQYSSIKIIDIAKGIEAIGRNAFRRCYQLKKVTLPKTCTTVEQEAFSGCSGLESVIWPSLCDTIPDLCFTHCAALKNFKLSGDITQIGCGAFSHIQNCEIDLSSSGHVRCADDVFSPSKNVTIIYPYYGCSIESDD